MTSFRSRILLSVAALVSVMIAGAQQSAAQSDVAITGTVKGHVRWDEKPIAGVPVKVCSDVAQSRCYSGVTDHEGTYVIQDVPPGEYEFFSRGPGDVPFTRWLGGQVRVESGKTYTQKTVDVTKDDLELISPSEGWFSPQGRFSESTVQTTSPTLTWKAYPGADNYIVMISPSNINDFKRTTQQRVTTTEFTVSPPLAPDRYSWSVSAYRGRTRIAESRLPPRYFVVAPPQ